MTKYLLCSLLLICSFNGNTQKIQDSLQGQVQLQINSAQRIMSGNYAKPITVGGYGEIIYNQPEAENGELDVQRLVLLFGYKFTDQIQFVTEIEFEHVQEVFIEQAFVNYNIADNINLRGGLMLVPMGLINEFHEPTTFNGTERPMVDNVIVPTTWREIGIGVSGRFPNLNLGYQAYVFNGFKSAIGNDNGGAIGLLRGSNGLRSGRQKGAQSIINSPTLATKLDFYGITGWRMGLSGYFGSTQAEEVVEKFEGSTVGIAMLGLDFRYKFRRFSARGEFIYSALSGADLYNNLTSSDLGSALQGWYLEGGYNVLAQDNKQQIIVFARYENADTHARTVGGLLRNYAYNRTDITVGLSYHLAPGLVLKGDYQLRKNAISSTQVKNRLNFGIGVWF